MSARRHLFTFVLIMVGLGVGIAVPAQAQARGNGKRYAVSSDKAMSVTRTVLQRQGYEVVRVAHAEDAQVIYYRRGSNASGNRPGNGKGAIERLVIRAVERRVVFEGATPAILADIDFGLKP
jgi:hypothetical protein